MHGGGVERVGCNTLRTIKAERG
ncbi:hypothetical protein A2U01_0112216, partial [Trifolium medium]|nr:hypothetical protein [Trifolium medium]